MAVDSFRAGVPARDEESGGLAHTAARLRDALPSRWVVALALAGLTAVSLALRVGALRFHYWIDEGLSVGIASHPLGAIPGLLRQDGSPPLYYLLLHLWMALRGRGEVATHELSLGFALLTVPAAFWAGATIGGRRAGLCCAVLAAGTPFLTLYGQETRMYSLLALLTLLAAAAFIHAFVLGHRRMLPVFALALTAALYTHNWALFLGLMAAMAYLVCLYRADRRSLARDGGLAFGAVALLYAPWVPTLLYQAAHTGAPWSDRPVLWSLTQGAYALVGGRGPAVALLLGGGAGIVALRREGLRAQLTIVVLLMLGAGTVLLAWGYAKLSPAWAVRYLAVAIGPLILLTGLGVARAGRLGLAALALTCLFWVVDPRPVSLNSKSNVAAAVAALGPRLGPGMLVLSTQPEQVPTLAYYLARGERYLTPAGPVPDPRVVDWRGILARMRSGSVQRRLLPALGSLAPGSRVLLAVPLLTPEHPAYLDLIRRDSLAWTRALRRDHQYRRLATTRVAAGVATLPVRLTLYARRDAPAHGGRAG